MKRTRRIALLVAAGALAAAAIALLRLQPAEPVRPPASLPPVASPAPSDRGGADAFPPDAASDEREDDEGSGGPAVDPADVAFVEAFGEPTPELVRASLEGALGALRSERPLDPALLEQASQALVDLRTLRAELDALPMKRSTAARRRALVEALGRASESFRAATDMTPAEFTARAAALEGGGSRIDREPGSESLPVDDFRSPTEDGGPELR